MSQHNEELFTSCIIAKNCIKQILTATTDAPAAKELALQEHSAQLLEQAQKIRGIVKELYDEQISITRFHNERR